MKKLFGTDGIRGVANKNPMTAEVAPERKPWSQNRYWERH